MKIDVNIIRSAFEAHCQKHNPKLSLVREVGVDKELLGYADKTTRSRFSTFKNGFIAAQQLNEAQQTKYILSKLKQHQKGLGIQTTPIPRLHNSERSVRLEQKRLCETYKSESFVVLAVGGILHGSESPFKEATMENFFKPYTSVPDTSENEPQAVLSDSAKEYDEIFGKLYKAVIASIPIREDMHTGALENFIFIKTVKTKEELVASFNNEESDMFSKTEDDQYGLLKAINVTGIDAELFVDYHNKLRLSTSERIKEIDFG